MKCCVTETERRFEHGFRQSRMSVRRPGQIVSRRAHLHGARVLVGSGHRRLLPAAFLLGGAFLVLSDTLARAASPAGELPVGAVTALAGAPFFLYLLRRNGGRS